MKRWVDFVIIGVMAVILCFFIFRKPNIDTEIITIHDTIHDDSTYEVLIPKPYPVYKDTGSIKWKDVDTSEILKDYYTKYYYIDTLKDDTSAFIQINDIVTENKLQDRKLIFQNRKPIIINTTITNIGEIPSTKFYLGAGFKTDINPILNNPQININALLVMKKRWAYEVEVGFPFNNIKNINVGFNAFYKISYKKR